MPHFKRHIFYYNDSEQDQNHEQSPIYRTYILKCFTKYPLINTFNKDICDHYCFFNFTFYFYQEFPCLDHDSYKSKRSKKRFWTRMKMYFNNFWNVVDLVASALYILADSVNVYLSDDEFTVSRRLYSLSLLVMYLRFFKVFLVHREIGTTLVMIKEMVRFFSN